MWLLCASFADMLCGSVDASVGVSITSLEVRLSAIPECEAVGDGSIPCQGIQGCEFAFAALMHLSSVVLPVLETLPSFTHIKWSFSDTHNVDHVVHNRQQSTTFRSTSLHGWASFRPSHSAAASTSCCQSFQPCLPAIIIGTIHGQPA